MDAHQWRDPVFKGATRPAMLFGVPLVPFVAVAASHLILAMWLLPLAGAFWAFVILAACFVELTFLRLLSTNDPHRLNQSVMAFAWNHFRRNRTTWGTHSMGPQQLKRR